LKKFFCRFKIVVKSKIKAKPLAKAPSADIANLKEMATRFYSDLSNKDRMIARSMLTEAAKSLAEDNKSALAHLPIPDSGKSALKVGKPKISDEQATIPVLKPSSGVKSRHETMNRQSGISALRFGKCMNC